jgi:hypothetical protein
LAIGGNSDSGGPGLGGVDGEGGPAGTDEDDAAGTDEDDAAGTDEDDAAGTGGGDAADQACGSDGSVRAVERDGSGWVRGAKGRRTWNRKPHAAQT